MTITPALENYVRVLYDLQTSEKMPRVKHVAKMLKVKVPTVVESLKKLENAGILEHEKYGYIRLTPKGIALAERIHKNNRIVYDFATRFLEFSSDEAQDLACKLEHINHPRFFTALSVIMDFLNENSELKKRFSMLLKDHEEVFGLTLASIEPGKTVKIKKLKGTESFNKRLMSMGIIPGVEVVVERIAPLGDPIEVKVKGYRLSLRREEARNILVEE